MDYMSNAEKYGLLLMPVNNSENLFLSLINTVVSDGETIWKINSNICDVCFCKYRRFA